MSPATTTAAPSNQPRAAPNLFAQSLLISSPSLRQYTGVILHPSQGSSCTFLCHHFTEQAERCCQWYPELVSHLLSIPPVGPLRDSDVDNPTSRSLAAPIESSCPVIMVPPHVRQAGHKGCHDL